MSYVSAYDEFLQSKLDFFSTPSLDPKQLASQKNYSYLLKHNNVILQEISQLENFFKYNQDRQLMIPYYDYCCHMLEAYYTAYDKDRQAKKYAALREKIREYSKPKKKTRPAKKQPFFTYLSKEIISELKSAIQIPLHISDMRAKLGLLNVYRIYCIFCRLTVIASFSLLKNTELLANLSRLLGKQINIDQIIASLKAPNPVFNVLSVGFFLVRLLMNAAILVKHAIFPTKKEKEVAALRRVLIDFWLKLPQILNDIVWALINLLTNYAQLFAISAMAAGWITAGFLVFDVLVLLWRRHLAEKEFLIKKAQYSAEFSQLQKEIDACYLTSKKHELVVRLAMLQSQMDALEIERKQTSDTFLFNAAAALLIALGFTASMLFTPGILVVMSYAIATIGVAMYLTADKFSAYRKQSLLLERAELNLKKGEKIDPALRAEYHAACRDFMFTFFRNAIFYGVMVATFAICWQAAVVLTAAYLVYQLCRAYKNQPKETMPADEEKDKSLGDVELTEPQPLTM